MAQNFLMPKLGLTMEEGTITEWLVDDDTDVTAGQAILRIETDKTETDVEAPGSGRLHQIGQVGETFACGETVGLYLDEGESTVASPAPVTAVTNGPTTADRKDETVAGGRPTPGAQPRSGRPLVSPNARRLAAERNLDLTSISGTGPNGRITSHDLAGASNIGAAGPTRPAASSTAASSAGVSSTVAGRMLADLLGIDLATVAPDPRSGRISREDVAAHVRRRLAETSASTSEARAKPARPLALQQPSEIVRLSGMRGTIAKRMSESLQSMAQLSLFMDADVDAIVADRTARKTNGESVSYTDYVIAAAAKALRQHPRVNAQITDDGIALLPEIHVGMAVALDEGLIVPVVRNTDGLDLEALCAETARLADAARSGDLGLPDLEGGTFSVSTLGMYGVDGFTPVINPPNAAILGVGRIRDELTLDADGNLEVTKRMTLSLTWDHRIFDGAPAAAFTQTIVELLANPAALDRPLAGQSQ